MSAIMNALTVMLFLGGSCSHHSSRNEELRPIEVQMESKTQIKVDSVVVNYWKNVNANEYRFLYTKGRMDISSAYFDFAKTVNGEREIQLFLNYINQFYLQKTEQIILSRKKEPAPVSDYAIISVVGYLNDEKVIEEKTTLYTNIEFNPDFIAFYAFLDGLTEE